MNQLSFAMMKLLLNWDFWVNSDCITPRERLEILYVCRDAAVIELISLSSLVAEVRPGETSFPVW